MKHRRYPEAQVIRILQEVDSGKPVMTSELGFSKTSHCEQLRIFCEYVVYLLS